MRQAGRLLRRYAARAFVLAALIGLYELAQLPSLSAADRMALVARFHFVPAVLPNLPGAPIRMERPVNPSFAHISSWISAVGAGVALSDISGSGLPNDACYVDTRTNQVIVAPVPGSGERYKPFALDFAAFRFDSTMAPMGCLPANLTESAATDLVVYFWGRTPVAFLHLPLPGPLDAAHFKAQELVPGDQRWFSNAATLADVDGNGHVDLIIGNYFPDGDRVLDPDAHDREFMQHSMSYALNGAGPRLLMWEAATGGADPSVRFRDVTDDAFPSVVRHGWVLAVGAADLTGDQLPDVYLADDFGHDRLLHNVSTPGHPHFMLVQGERAFLMPRSKTLGLDSFKGMGVDFGDLGCRGLLDIFVSHITTEFALEESNFMFMNTGDVSAYKRGVAPFVDRSESLGLSRGGWGWDAKLADFDNSGALQAMQAVGFVRGTVDRWPELQELAMSNDQLVREPFAWLHVKPGDDIAGHQQDPFFVQSAGGTYYNIAPELHPRGSVPEGPSRGIAIADSFGDGRLDYAVARQWGPTIFYRNLAPAVNKYLELELRLPIEAQQGIRVFPGGPNVAPPSRPAIGAAATVHLTDGRSCLAQVDGGNGHSGKNAPGVHFGLGDAAAEHALPVTLQWRDAAGHPWSTTARLAPGRYTVLLGSMTSAGHD